MKQTFPEKHEGFEEKFQTMKNMLGISLKSDLKESLLKPHLKTQD